jgi:hypothetical protein
VQVRGHLLVKQAVNSPQKHILRIFKIDLVAADLSIELLGVEFIVYSSLTMVWHAHPACPKHLVAALERHVNAFPAAYLLPPQSGEIFDSISHCERRLRAYAMAQGFDIASTGGGTRAAPGCRFQCSYHGDIIKNWRHLEDHIEKDKECKVTSKRQREGIIVGQLNCQWLMRVS